MAELEEILDNEWRALTGAAADAPSPLALPASRRMPLSPIALFAQIEEVREEWRALRESIGQSDAERYVNAGWTLKELLAHAASWAKEFRYEVEAAWRGERFDYAIPYVMTVTGPNEWNEEQVRLRDNESLDAIFDELDGETLRLQDLLAEMPEQDLYAPRTFPLAPTGDPDVKWQGPSAFIVWAKCEHDRHHIRQIKERLAAWRQR